MLKLAGGGDISSPCGILTCGVTSLVTFVKLMPKSSGTGGTDSTEGTDCTDLAATGTLSRVFNWLSCTRFVSPLPTCPKKGRCWRSKITTERRLTKTMYFFNSLRLRLLLVVTLDRHGEPRGITIDWILNKAYNRSGTSWGKMTLIGQVGACNSSIWLCAGHLARTR